MKKKALISGVSGQDGAYLARFLLGKGYEVYGTSRDAQLSRFDNLKKLGVSDRVKKFSMILTDFRSVLSVLKKVNPDEIYNLAGQSSVSLSFEQPVETLESVSLGVLNLLESIRFMESDIKLYNAGSSECFGDTPDEPANEETLFRPKSPYSVAKAAAFWQVANYRDAYGLKACTGILFNHDSILRPERFVTKKIILAACRIKNGSKEKLHLGNINIIRDWGWASEYVEAMWRMLQRDDLNDYVIATGDSYSLKDFVEYAFYQVGLNWEDYVLLDDDFLRPSDIYVSRANPSKANSELGWMAKNKMKDIVDLMINDCLSV